MVGKASLVFAEVSWMMKRSQQRKAKRKRESQTKPASENWKTQISSCKTHSIFSFFFFDFWWLGLLKRSSVYHCDHRLADFSKSSVRRPVWTRVLSRGKSVVSTKCKPGEHFLVATPRAGPETLSFSTLFLDSMCATRLAPVTSRLNSQQPVCAATGRVASQWGLDWGWGRVKVPMARGLQTRILLEMALLTDPSSLQALDSVKHQHTKAVITVVLQGKKKMIFTFIC